MTAAQRVFVDEPQKPENLIETLVQKARKLAPTLRQRARRPPRPAKFRARPSKTTGAPACGICLSPRNSAARKYDRI